MKITSEWILFLLLTIINLSASLAICWYSLSGRVKSYTLIYRIFMVIGLIGLVGQAFRNIVFLSTGTSLSDATLPLWAFKDIGLAGIGFCYVFSLTRTGKHLP
jgi:hypothetical protein